MRTPRQLFRRRLSAYFREQWEALRTAVDWVIAIYFIIPGLIASGYIYISLWDELPMWTAHILPEFIFSFLYLYAVLGSLRTFLEPADQVFLLQRNEWLHRIRVYGFLYSITLQALSACLLFALLSPFLVQLYQWDFVGIVILAGYTLGWKIILSVIMHGMKLRFRGWQKYVARLVVFIGCGLLFNAGGNGLSVLKPSHLGLATAIVCVCLVWLIAVWMLRRRLHWRGALYLDIEAEREARMKLTGFLVQQSVGKEEKPWLSKRKPFLFRSSQRIFKKRDKESVLAEMVIKSLLRSRSNWMFALQFVGVSSAAILVTPSWFKLLTIGGLVFVLYKGLHSFCADAADTAYLELYQWNDTERMWAARKAVQRLGMPIVYFLTGLLIVNLFVEFGLF